MNEIEYNDLIAEAEVLWLNYYDECIYMRESPHGFNTYLRMYHPYILEELERLENA